MYVESHKKKLVSDKEARFVSFSKEQLKGKQYLSGLNFKKLSGGLWRIDYR